MQDIKKLDIKKIILSKINRKLTLFFVIVGLISSSLAIYFFYTILVGTFPEGIYTGNALLVRIIALTIIVISSIYIGIIGFLISQSISKPIKELYRAIREVENGNYDVKLNIKNFDEIGKFAQAFNKITATRAKLELERKEISKIKNEFLNITLHELRNPMTPMKAQLHMLEKGYFGKLSKKQKESIEIILRNTDRLDKIIIDFFDISRIEAARLKFNFQETNIKQLIIDTAKFMKCYAKEKNIQIVINIDELPHIEVDPDRVSQILRNLINNAIKFSKKNSKIEIKAEMRKDYIQISVKDYGCGLTPKNQIRIFEPFYQVENSTEEKKVGTGLGLAICRGIVESQNGKIWVESKPNKGCKFYFTIPLKPDRQIKPIKLLFLPKDTIESKIKEEFNLKLGPLGINEFNELKSKNAINRDDLGEYVDKLIDKYIITQEKGHELKNRIQKILGYQKDDINEKIHTSCDNLGDKVVKCD